MSRSLDTHSSISPVQFWTRNHCETFRSTCRIGYLKQWITVLEAA